MLLPAVDTEIGRSFPGWYDDYLDRPRQHTRLCVPLDDIRLVGPGQLCDDDDHDDDHDDGWAWAS